MNWLFCTNAVINLANVTMISRSGDCLKIHMIGGEVHTISNVEPDIIEELKRKFGG